MIKWVGYFLVEHMDKNGNSIWKDEGPNNLANEGQQLVLDTFLRGAAAPAGFFLRLVNDAVVKTDTLVELIGEPAGGSAHGYTPKALERSNVGWPTLALDAGDYQATSKQVIFDAVGGSVGPVNTCILATSSDNAGKLIAFKPLSQSRTLQDGESLKVTFMVKLMPSA